MTVPDMKEGGGDAEAEEGEEEVAAACAPAPNVEAELRRVASHVDSAISSSYSVKSFPGKWQPIRTKLSQLSCGLTLAAATVRNSALWELLRAITTAAEEAQRLASDRDADARARAVREGAVNALVRVLHPESSSSSCKAREAALMAIQALCYSPGSSVNALLATGFLDRVLFFLRNGETSLQGAALKAAWRFSTVSDEARKAMGDAGFMPELVGLLEVAKSPEVRETAAAALVQLVAEQRNRRRFIQEEENGVGRILRVLVAEGERAAAMASLLAVLAAIDDSNSRRRKITSCHYVEHLQKLADMGVADAKRIIKKLSGNKFMNILSGIWSS